MNQNISKKHLRQFKTFEGIYLIANKTYYLCDFYFQSNEQSEDIYTVKIESPQNIKSELQFVFSPILTTWVCTNSADQQNELIEQIISEIIKANKH